MKVLVTGGVGFIGKHFVKFILGKNYSVTILDNFSNSIKESISHIIQIVVEGDIRHSYVNKSKGKRN
jgi:UDP-glucose 4-epimerase